MSGPSAQAGCSGVRLHDLRHRNAATTLNVYAHFLPGVDRDAANLLGRMLDDATDDLGGGGY